MWELDHKEGWALKNWCFQTVVLEKTHESLLDCKEIQPVHSEGDQSWVFFERNDVKLKLQYFDHLMGRADSLEEILMLGNIEGKRRRGVAEGEVVGWHHWLNGHKFEQTLRDSEGQGSLAFCSPWGLKESDMTEWLNWTELKIKHLRDQVQKM